MSRHTDAEHPEKDWPANLRLSAGKDSLAVAMYEQRCVAFGLPQWPWDKITELEKATWRAEALAWLMAHTPAPRFRGDYFTPFVSLTRARFGRKETP